MNTSDAGTSYHVEGDDYYHGRDGKQKDDARAFMLWLKGAELGNIQCIKNVIWACENGIGIQKGSLIANRFRSKNQIIYYSDQQILQDKWVESIFEGMRGGYFLDIGASEGIGGSNTKMLEESFGWEGICIEANPHFYHQLAMNRLALCVNAAVSPVEEEVTFRAAGYYGGIEKNLTEWHRKDWQDSESIIMRTRMIGDILDECEAPEVIDYVSLDIEGGEAEIIESFPFDRYKVLTMTVEQSHPRLVDVVKSKGFQIVKNPFSQPHVNWELHCIHESLT
jgi:FkbM family methyltransferase